jgi:hypothetical protein
MHAVVVTVAISDHEVAERHLHEEVVPGYGRPQGSWRGTGHGTTTRDWGWSCSSRRTPPRP